MYTEGNPNGENLRTIKELSIDSNKIIMESQIIWETEWLPRFNATTTKEQFRIVQNDLMDAAGVDDTSKLPGLMGVELVFAMDQLRQRML